MVTGIRGDVVTTSAQWALVKRFVQLVVILLCAILLTPPGAAHAEPTPPAVTSTYRKVMPLAGPIAWGAQFGQAGSMWSSGHHTGQDMSAPAGAVIMAVADGVVVFTGNGGPYGNLTRIRHADGVESWYAHQSLINTSVGTNVKAGSPIGLVGATGNTTGPHLHLEIRIGGQPVDPRAWLSGAAVTPGAAVAGTTFDPAVVDELRGNAAAADAALAAAQRDAQDANAKAAELTKQADTAQAEADAARAQLTNYVREVYKTGLDPKWLLQADSLTETGNPQDFSDRQTYMHYANSAQDKLMVTAADAAQNAMRLRDEATAHAQQATNVMAAASEKAALSQAQLAASSWIADAGGSWDGVIPEGGSKQALAAVKFAISQVGHPYTSAGGTGPEYGCNGFTWRAWHEAGSPWPLQMAHMQATNRQWVVPVPSGQEKPGDLIFWVMNNGTDSPGRMDHVAMVVNPGTGVMVHAGSTRVGVEFNNYKTSSFYKTPAMFGRVIVAPEKPTKAPHKS